ncbi:Serine/threonine-protein kinase tel1 [Aspergillus melleus]|uniref:Serine/threonine-protein kinase tel1 n=1 Tax=Aspergillus melleus TaxID=138277 RepID=A0ACC3AT36_9EURO|nr:Serine/threonine-protein kinase tel1 [Aspergillus melleus]
MGEISLDRALALLSSEKQKERSDGLADLKHIFQQNKQNSKLSSLNDKACHKIFESLFRLIAAEKSVFTRANFKGPSASRLSTCASVIRTAIDVFLPNLRVKSVRAITDHITDTLLTPRHDLFDLLGVDYTKCLSTLLNYPPHVEHLGASEWEKLVSFCLRSISLPEDEESEQSFSNSRRSTLDDFRTGGSRGKTPSRATSALAVREKPRGDQSAIIEALNCIQVLTASPSAPIQDSAERILEGLAKFLKSPASIGSGHLAAISSLNSVTMRVLFDQSSLVRVSMLDLIPTIRYLWATKLTSLKDELLVTIMLCMVIIIDTARKEPSELLAQLIDNLVDTLYFEYTRRPEKDSLQIDELTFYQKASSQEQNIAGSPDVGPTSLHDAWQRVWDLASRASTSHTTSRAACTLMTSILQFELLEYSASAEAINSMLSSVNLNGPSLMSDSSLAFWATVTRAIAQINPGSVPHASKLICTWLREAWTIGSFCTYNPSVDVANDGSRYNN